MSALIYKGIDTASPISAEAAKKLRELGYSFVGRYLVPESGSTKWKALTAAEAKSLRDAGLAILLCWETTASRARNGATAGASDAATAAELAKKMGIPDGTAIFFAVDYDAPASDYTRIEAYLRGAKWNLGGYRLGLYAPAAVLNYMAKIDPNLVDYGWQCYAWSYGMKANAHFYQTAWQGDAKAQAVQKQVGFAVDLDEADSLDGLWMRRDLAQTALEWAQSYGIVSGSTETDKAIALAIWKYHNTFSREDSRDESGAITD